MPKPTCSIETCERESVTRGWCNAHYIRNQRHGSPLATARKPTVEERFWAKVIKTETCWEWQGYVMPNGYGQFYGKEKLLLAHRYSYEAANGAVSQGVEVDHICFNRKCVRPEHLRTATHKQNAEHLRGAASNNKSSGIRGVYWREDCKKWEVKVGHNLMQHNVGMYASIAEAESAAIAKRLELFTHNSVDRRSRLTR